MAERATAPESEGQRLWELFSVTLASAGIDPSQYREDFEAEYRRVADRPYDDKLSDIMRFASEIVRTNRPRPAQPSAAPAELQQVLQGLRDTLDRLNRSLIARPPSTPQELLLAVGAELASVPPEESVESIPVSSVKQTPQECGGYTHVWAPNADALGEMRAYGVHTIIIRKFYTCPEMWRYEADGNADLEYTVAVMKEAREVPPFFANWLMELAKAIDDKYEREGRLEGIARYRDLKKRLGGRFTAVGK